MLQSDADSRDDVFPPVGKFSVAILHTLLELIKLPLILLAACFEFSGRVVVILIM